MISVRWWFPALIALAITGAGCSFGFGSSASPQQQFLESIGASNKHPNQYDPYIPGTSRELVASGNKVCLTLGAGPATMEQLELALAPMDNRQARVIVITALWNLCTKSVNNLK